MGDVTLATQDIRQPQGPQLKAVIVDVTMNASYAAGGDTIDLSSHFPNYVFGGMPIEVTDGYHLHYVADTGHAPATGKIKAYYYDYDAGADGAAIDVAATTNLATGIGAHAWIFWGY